MLFNTFTLQPHLSYSGAMVLCSAHAELRMMPSWSHWGRFEIKTESQQSTLNAYTHTHTQNSTVTALGAFSLLNEALSLWGLGGQQVTQGRTETRSANSSELCKEVWSQCQSKSYLLDAGRKGSIYVCPQSSAEQCCIIGAAAAAAAAAHSATLLYFLNLTHLSVSFAPWQSHVNSIIQQLGTLKARKETAA